jgi:hypothetical protein
VNEKKETLFSAQKKKLFHMPERKIRSKILLIYSISVPEHAN